MNNCKRDAKDWKCNCAAEVDTRYVSQALARLFSFYSTLTHGCFNNEESFTHLASQPMSPQEVSRPAEHIWYLHRHLSVWQIFHRSSAGDAAAASALPVLHPRSQSKLSPIGSPGLKLIPCVTQKFILIRLHAAILPIVYIIPSLTF